MWNQSLDTVQAAYLDKIRKRVNQIGRLVWTEKQPVTDTAIAETAEHLSPVAACDLPYEPLTGPRRWGRPWSTAWFRLRITIPEAFAGEPVALLFYPEGECIIFEDGKPVQALDRNHHDRFLTRSAVPGQTFELYIEAGASCAFGKFEVRTAELPEIAVYNDAVWNAWHDLRCLNDLVSNPDKGLSRDDTRRHRIIYGLNQATDLFDHQDTSREAVRASAHRVSDALADLYSCPAVTSAQTIACMGHAHIDVAWLWPLAETRRKCGRTFSSMLDLMDRYPEFTFCQSQPQLYAYTREDYPSLYERIREKVAAGQWIPTGCMWVESDCNVPSGESLVRQILFGTRFFKQEFDHDTVCLWVPDVFGYSGNLPQILKRSGIEYFLTQKLSWNQFNTFPHHSFHWEGIDGSSVLTHMPPANTYNGCVDGPEILGAARRYAQKDRSEFQVLPYGFGDGGGGVTAEQCESIRRYADLEGAPKTVPMTPADFFAALAAESATFPRHVGELYLELHRATLTSQAAAKRGNRKSELALRDAEFLSVAAARTGLPYPREAINGAWEKVLLNQFHDILPGSSIDLVYQDVAADYRTVADTVADVQHRARTAIAGDADTRGEGIPVIACNTLSWEREAVVAVEDVELPADQPHIAVDADGNTRPVQVGADGVPRFLASLPSLGWTVFHLRPGTDDDEEDAPHASATHLENASLRVELDDQARVTRIIDKVAGRDALTPGATGNRLQLFEDKPNAWDAWDTDVFGHENLLVEDGTLESVECIEQGPVRAVVRIRRTISASTIAQDLILDANSSRVEFHTTVDWRDEKEVFLKVAFPVAVRAAEATYEIQFGSLTRPTHTNTLTDLSRFDTCGHKWADLSQPDFGVALLNDCKYGHTIRGNVIHLSLLRAPKSPDPTADVNQTHRFVYAVQPHAGDHTRGGVVQAGHELNTPTLAWTATPGPGAGATRSLATVTGDVIIDTVKQAEDDDSVILRCYEPHGCNVNARITLGLPVAAAAETNLMERHEQDLDLVDGAVDLEFAPFQIRTLKLSLNTPD